MRVRITDIIDLYQRRRPGGDGALIQRAYVFSAKRHEGQVRKSGEPYLTHPLAVAGIVAELGLDEATICAALLHDTIEDTGTTREELETIFGVEIAFLVEGLTKLAGVNFKGREARQAESFRKLLLAMVRDIRVLLVKLADRLHNMRTLEHMEPEARARIAEETRDIYAPLANRMGISWLRSELDDLAFKHLEPERYADLALRVARSREDTELQIETIIAELRRMLEAASFRAEVSGRQKNLWSIEQKMIKKGLDFENVHDAIAFRVVCASVQDCYAILGLIHTRWVPIPGRFKDYIAVPKPNRYQSLHTTVVTSKGEQMEVQIRTEEMHAVAELGIAAHWAYKQGQAQVEESERRNIAWIRELLDSPSTQGDPTALVESVKSDLLGDDVYVFTPAGDVKALGQNATALDFAYHVHSEVGHHCVGARVNGAQVPLGTRLRNGDIVEILTSKTQRPSGDWMRLVATRHAKDKIRSYLLAEQRRQSRQVGEELLEKALRHHGLSYSRCFKAGLVENVAKELRFQSVDDLLAAIGYGKLDKEDVVARLAPPTEKAAPDPEVRERALEKLLRRIKPPEDGIVLDGVEDLLVRFARCCNPLPGEPIIGYVTRGHGIVVHHRDCSQAQVIDPERRTTVTWSAHAVSQRPVKLTVTSTNRPGILAALSAVFHNQGINLSQAFCKADGADRAVCSFTFSVRDVGQLNQLVRGLRALRGIIGVERAPL